MLGLGDVVWIISFAPPQAGSSLYKRPAIGMVFSTEEKAKNAVRILKLSENWKGYTFEVEPFSVDPPGFDW